MFYTGKEFDLKTNKEYKTLDGAKKAAEKEALNVYDEVGQQLASYMSVEQLVDKMVEKATEILEAAAEEQAAAAKEEAAEAVQEQQEGGQEPSKEEGVENLQPDSVEAVQGKIQRVFAGKLRIRRAPSDDPGAACGVSFFDRKRVTEKHTVAGKVWYKTMDGYFISGDPAHTKFIPDGE